MKLGEELSNPSFQKPGFPKIAAGRAEHNFSVEIFSANSTNFAIGFVLLNCFV